MLRPARRERLGLTKGEFRILDRLTSPPVIQDFLNRLPSNHEPGGETLYSVRQVLANRRAHCMEAAMLAACALWMHGDPPWIMRLGCHESDYPHVVALFRRGRRWGALSKSNGGYLRYRDPVYSSLRELAMSYFHEYANRRGRKTLRSYSARFDLRRLDTRLWVTADEGCWIAHDRVEGSRHYPLLSPAQEQHLARQDRFAMRIARIEEHCAPAALNSPGTA